MEKDYKSVETDEFVKFLLSMSYEELMDWRKLFARTRYLEELLASIPADDIEDDVDEDFISLIYRPDGEKVVCEMMTDTEFTDKYGETNFDFETDDTAIVLCCHEDGVVHLGGHIYIVGPAQFVELDDEGYACDICTESAVQVMDFVETNTVKIAVDGKNFMAIRLM